MPKITDTYYMGYEAMRFHVGHKLEINDVWDWGTNRETSIEIRCIEKSCEGCEPLFEMDKPKERTKTITPRVWSRKGRCPSCKVSTGSKHAKICRFKY